MTYLEELKNNPGQQLLRIVILFIGLVIAHLGVSLFLLADLGSDPFNVMIQGIYRSLSEATGLAFLTHGRVHIVVCFLIIVILLFTDKSYVRIGTFVCMIFGGPIIDVYNKLLGPIFSGGMALAVRIVFNVLGCVILAYGMTIVIKSDAGTGPNDLVAVVISDKLKKKFGIVRVIVDVCFALTGFLLGGTVGLGTVICAFLVGPVANIFLPVNERIINKVMARLRK